MLYIFIKSWPIHSGTEHSFKIFDLNPARPDGYWQTHAKYLKRKIEQLTTTIPSLFMRRHIAHHDKFGTFPQTLTAV